MATDLFKGFTNPISGESFRCISSTREVYSMEWIVQPEGYVPFEHIHLNQDEVFHVQIGELRILINGKEQIVKEGETVTVPKGERHIAYNNKPELLQCIVEYRPGLDYFTFSQCFGGLILDRQYDKKGQISIPKMGYFQVRMKARCTTLPTNVPRWILLSTIKVFYYFGALAGWNKLYVKYTGNN